MNQTNNYQLSQWDPEDRILRADFNSDNSKVDAALKNNADAVTAEASARANADSAEASARASAIAAEASARTSAVAELTAALELKGNCQIYYTTYVGDGADSKTLTFPRKPLLVQVMGNLLVLHAIQGVPQAISHNETGYSSAQCSAEWSGNSFTWSHSRYNLNDSGETYYVVALMAMDQ